MAKGRPPELAFDPANPGSVSQTVVHLDDRGRIQFPSKIFNGWSSRGDQSYALATLIEPGRIRFHPWGAGGALAQSKRFELIQQALIDPNAIEVLRALEDRYKRLQIPLGGRPTLTSEMITHLAVSPPVDVYAWRVQDVLEVNSIDYRLKELLVEYEEFSDLPR